MRTKIIFIVFFLGTFLCFLSGCVEKTVPKTVLPAEPVIQQPASLESYLPIDTGKYLTPKISISQGLGRVVQGRNDNPTKKHTWIKKSEDGEAFFESTEVGYLYTYSYPDLGIKITTPPLYEPYFSTKTMSSIFKRNGSIVYTSGSTNFLAEYIEVLKRDPTISFSTQIQNIHTLSGCKIELVTGVDLNFLTEKDFLSISLSDASYGRNSCIQDKAFPTNTSNILFLMNPKRPDIYYKISFGADCAPGPCSIFGKIELF